MNLFSEYRGLRKELYILFIGRMMTNLGSLVNPMITLILSEKLGLNAAKVAAYLLIYTICSMPMNLLGGKLADKYNKRNIIIICDLFSIAGYIYCSMVEINMVNITIFAVAGLLQSVEWPSYDALLSDLTTSKDRERANSLMYLGGNLGFAVAPTIAGFLFNTHLNLAFLISGLAIALSTMLIFLKIKDVHREVDTSEAAAYEAVVDDKISPFTLIWNNKVIFIFTFIHLLSNSVYGMWDYLVPLELADVHLEQGPVLYGTMVTVNCITVVTCTALVTKIFRKTVDIRKIFIGEALYTIGFLVFALFVEKVSFCYIGIIVFTLGEIFVTITFQPFLSRRIPASHRGRINSVINVIANIGAACAKYIAGIFYDQVSPFSAWLFTFAMSFAILILILGAEGIDRKNFAKLYEK